MTIYDELKDMIKRVAQELANADGTTMGIIHVHAASNQISLHVRQALDHVVDALMHPVREVEQAVEAVAGDVAAVVEASEVEEPKPEDPEAEEPKAEGEKADDDSHIEE